MAREDNNLGINATNPSAMSRTLKVKIASSNIKQGEESLENSCLPSPNIKSSIESTPYGSPLVSPPSSAFVSALQSPYISPRAIISKPLDESTLENQPLHSTITTHPSTPEDVPSSSYTPPSDAFEFSDDTSDTKLKYVTCVPVPEAADPRISFSFPVPRISFAKGPISPASNSKLRSCDVYIGFHGQNPKLLRFCKWLKSELEHQGIDCLLADRAKYSDSQSHEIADRVICSVPFGLVVVTSYSFLNHLSMEEVRFFAQKKNLIPLLFDTGPAEIMALLNCNSIDKECKEAIDGLMKCNEFNLEANDGNWRSCVTKAATILRAKLGRKNADMKNNNVQGFENLPFPRNTYFVGREKEIIEIEGLLFGNGNCLEQVQDHCMKGEASGSGQSEGLGDEESEMVIRKGGRYISLEMGKSTKEPTLEAWVEPIIGNNKRLKNKKSKSGNYKSLCSSVICINGVSGIGKSELALEFAHRYYQRYKMVLWVGGEARYLRQNILNLSLNFGLDVGADSEMERGRMRSFEEQEFEAFKRIKRELFGETPYLVIIDNLETEEEWWEGKDLYDLIPRNTGGTHVIVTTRLSKVMNYDIVQLPPLPLSDAMILIRGRKKKDNSAEAMEFLEKFNDKLGRLSFGLWLIGSLLSELAIEPSDLFEAINQVPLNEESNSCYMSIEEEKWFKSNPFLTKTLHFCLRTLEKTKAKENLLAIRMLLVSGWFSPVPISSSLLLNTAKGIPIAENSLKKWTKCLSLKLSCFSSRTWKSEEDSAMLLVKIGLARIANHQDGCWIQFHPITQAFARTKGGLQYANAAVQGVRKMGNHVNLDQSWASAFLVFGFKSDPPIVQLKPNDMVLYIKKTALPLAVQAFTTFSRCNSALELLKVCTNALEEVEKSFVSQIQDWSHDSICWQRRLQRSQQKVDEYVWQDVTLLKATLLETRAKLLARGGHLDSGKELCRTCISIRTVMLGHNHAQTLAAQETLARLVRMRSKI
ncbi:hypothetical protein TanjilG_25738 [Lupinus angustifolius]|uniref:AAA+ ATPase domain-containing protein n=1 Tax=Lupinus angustifolius TaxID=3871 RepID=A0A394DM46_LUPAN|nr:PREDICTED: uncharacterized protein LOC109339064 [Lupinus angustifolius]OIW20931.1 hypothetical protein TanjilG_25738 [Lupinus angustifolius]